ncbi:MAG: DinB family protein [Fimbriimonadaceae bacterium]|nr:DinB family protein [Fimbriimonadaceae bacterium]
MNPLVESALAELEQADGRLRRAFEKTPDDRLLWSPGGTARTAISLVAHCAYSLGFIAELFHGKPYPAPTTEQADAEHLARENAFSTRAEALALWDAKLAEHRQALTSLTEEQIASTVVLPFNLGQAPLSMILNVGSRHTHDHMAQLDYLQTTWGDRSWN